MKSLLRETVNKDLPSVPGCFDRGFRKLDRVCHDILSEAGKISLRSACCLALEIGLNRTGTYRGNYDVVIDEFVIKRSGK